MKELNQKDYRKKSNLKKVVRMKNEFCEAMKRIKISKVYIKFILKQFT